MENYSDFVVHKSERAVHTDSIVLTVNDLNDRLYDFQKTSCGGRWQRAAPLFLPIAASARPQCSLNGRIGCVCIRVGTPSL